MRPVKNPIEIVPGMADAIAARMTQLHLSPTDLSIATGVTAQGLIHLRRGERRAYQDRLKFPVCRILKWTPDSIDRLMRGEPPVPTDAGAPTDVTTRLSVLEERVARMAEQLLLISERVLAPDADEELIGDESRTEQ